MNEQYRNAIGTVESSNDYSALGPWVNRPGGRRDRAYGRYQVMGENIPEWTARHLGVAMTPEQFLADQTAQDKVFDAETSNAYKKYGNLDDVTSTWFSGRPLGFAGNASDGYNTVPQYVSKVNRNMGGVDAINAAAGGPGAGKGALSLASTDDEGTSTGGALTPPPGALYAGQEPNKLNAIGQGLTGIGAALAGITSPEEGKALTAQMVSMQKAGNEGLKIHTIDSKTGIAVGTVNGRPVSFQAFTPKAEDDAYATEQKKLKAKTEDDRYNTAQAAIPAADEQLATIKELRRAIQNPDVTFGGLGNAAASAKNIASSLGMDVAGLTDTQIIQRLATKMQLSQGKLLPGAISNYEDKLLGLANGVGVDKTREANLAALDAQEAIFNHQKALALEAQKYKATHGALDQGWDQYMSQWMKSHPVQLNPDTANVSSGAAPKGNQLPRGVRSIQIVQ